jgi:hypothetical protein
MYEEGAHVGKTNHNFRLDGILCRSLSVTVHGGMDIKVFLTLQRRLQDIFYASPGTLYTKLERYSEGESICSVLECSHTCRTGRIARSDCG